MNPTWWVDEDDLDDDQKAVIGLPIDRNQLFYGPAGCGKTNLLLMKGSQFVLVQRPNVQFLVFTNGLREWIRGGATNYEFDSANVLTFNGFMKKFLRQEQVRFENQMVESFPEDRQTLIRLCTQHSKQKNYKGMYDAIIIDEGQDCVPGEVALFSQLGKVVIVALDERQQIYDTRAGIEAWRQVIPPNNTVQLRNHYRNGKKICGLADEISAVEPRLGMLATSRYDEKRFPSVVRHTECENLGEEIFLAIASLQTEQKAYKDEMLGVLCATRPTLSKVASLMQQHPISEACHFHINEGDGYKAFGSGKQIFVGTIYGAKGLEFRTVHLLEANEIKGKNQRNLAYTAVTRSKTSLNVYYSGNLSNWLSSALSTIGAKIPQPRLSELFGKKRKDVDSITDTPGVS